MMRIDTKTFLASLPINLCVVVLMYALLTWSDLAFALIVLCLLNMVTIPVAKNLFRQRRPARRAAAMRSSSHNLGMGVSVKGDRWGMPSGHTQITASICALLAFVVVTQKIPSARPWQRTAYKFITLPLLLLLPIAVAWQRVHSAHHTVPQTVVGFGIGVGLAALIITLLPSLTIVDSLAGLSSRRR